MQQVQTPAAPVDSCMCGAVNVKHGIAVQVFAKWAEMKLGSDRVEGFRTV